MKIIINADDFGISSSVNDNIVSCHKNGCLTSTSIIAYGEAFNEAVKLAKENPRLGTGVHLVLDGPFNIPYFKSTLINPETKAFYNKEDVIRRINKTKHADLVKLYSLQIEKVIDNKINISHIDHHHHFQRYYKVLNALIDVAKKYKIKYIRSQNILLNINKSLINKLYRLIHQFYLKKKLNTIDGYFDIFPNNYENSLNRLVKLLNLKTHIIEIVVHLRNMEDFDTQFLLDKRVNELLNQHELINYNNLK